MASGSLARSSSRVSSTLGSVSRSLVHPTPNKSMGTIKNNRAVFFMAIILKVQIYPKGEGTWPWVEVIVYRIEVLWILPIVFGDDERIVQSPEETHGYIGNGIVQAIAQDNVLTTQESGILQIIIGEGHIALHVHKVGIGRTPVEIQHVGHTVGVVRDGTVHPAGGQPAGVVHLPTDLSPETGAQIEFSIVELKTKAKGPIGT